MNIPYIANLHIDIPLNVVIAIKKIIKCIPHYQGH